MTYPYRKRLDFKVRLRYNETDHETGIEYPAESIVEVDEFGDPPGPMSVQDIVIADTTVFLDWDEYEIVD